LAVMMYVGFSNSLRNVEDLLHERSIDFSHETIRYWWNRFDPIFAAEITGSKQTGAYLHPFDSFYFEVTYVRSTRLWPSMVRRQLNEDWCEKRIA
jgi:transposase-like protein